MASQLGKRYKCEICGTEVKSQEAKPIPSSD
jgi:DNA-directed RNA polymerase subunit RPC12/RpoP